MSNFDIQLFGDFRLIHDGRSLTNSFSTRLQTLLIYLLLHRRVPQPRRHIAFLFWPDTTEKQALSNLRTLYARLRQQLPNADHFLQSDNQSIQWLPDSPYTLDVNEFETAVSTAKTTADWQKAVNLYRGSLLPGWYDEWLEPERERLQQQFILANETLMQMLEDQRDYQKAVQAARRLLLHDPFHEATYRRLMRLQALAGNRADALRTYHTCASLLGKELDVSPDKATRNLYERLLHAGLSPEQAPVTKEETADISLIGRDEEWRLLKRAWQTAVRGHASMVLISGEAGIGKSRLAAELMQWAQRQGIDTATTRSYEAEGELAYAPVLTWLWSPVLQAGWKKLDDITLTELARLMPELRIERLDLPAPTPLTHSWQRQKLFEALAQAILARGRPLLLHIDDLQWCDQESLQWLHFLLRFDPKVPLLVIGACRPEEISARHPVTALKLALRQSRQLMELELQPLSESNTGVLATQLSGQSLDSADVGRLYQETEGNPLFVVEMMRAGLPEPHVLPPTIQAMIQARFTRLTPQARELMAQATVIGRSFDYDLLAQISGMDEDMLVSRLDELWRRRIIREHGGAEYDFSHDKIREVAYTELSQTRRRLLHQRVAQSLEAHHSSHIEAYSGQIAAHYEMADMHREAIPHYQRAANAARQMYANADAIKYIQRALHLMPLLPTTTPASWRLATETQLYETIGDILSFTARYDEAQDAYKAVLTAIAAATDSHPVQQCRLHRKIGSACLPQHRYEEALHQFEQAKAALGAEPVGSNELWWREWIDLQHERKYAYYWLNRWPQIAEILEESRPILARYGTSAQRASFFDPGIFYRRDRFALSEDVVEFTREWLAANMELGNPIRLASAHFGMGFTLLWHGSLSEAEAEVRTALEMTIKTGDVNLRARCLTYLTIIYRKQEQVEQVRLFTAQSVAAAEETAMPEYVAMGKANIAWLAWRDGNLSQTRLEGCAALALWQTLPSGHASCAFQWTALFPLMAVALAEGELDEAFAYAQAVLDPSQQKLPEELTTALQNTIIAQQQNQYTHAAQLLTQAITLAQEMQYL